MEVKHGKIEGDFTLDKEVVFHGLCIGNIIVKKSGILFLHGLCNRDLLLEKGSEVFLHGIVNGNVINKGGDLQVFGIINGNLSTEDGTTVVNKNAILKNRQ